MRPRVLFAALAFGLAVLWSGPAARAADVPAPAASPARMRAYPNLLHVGIVVRDIDKSVAETDARFGHGKTKVASRFTLNVVDGLYRGQTVSFAAKFCLIELGNTQIEFIEPVGSAPSPYADALRETGETAHHLAFHVDSIEATLAAARVSNPNLTLVLDAKIQGGRVRYVYVDGIIPGILVEYVETER